jgi:hypothetical protein
MLCSALQSSSAFSCTSGHCRLLPAPACHCTTTPPPQTASIYKHGNTLLPRYYTFKVQSVQSANPSSCSSTVSTPGAAQSADISGRCKTIARARLDLAQFCNAESAGPGPATEVQVPLEPQGILHLSIKTVWLQHYDRSQPRQLQLQVQGSEHSAAQLWGGSSDVATTHTDKSSVTSSIVGSYHGDEDRAACESSMPPLP